MTWKPPKKLAASMVLTGISLSAYAAGDLGNLASTIYGNFYNLSKLVTAGSYIAGLGFAIASIMKFKAHKDNPTQIQIGTPVALVMIASALLFLPSILDTAGLTMFSSGGEVATSTGTAWTPPTQSFDGGSSSGGGDGGGGSGGGGSETTL